MLAFSTKCVNINLYADDTILYGCAPTQTLTHLQSSFDSFQLTLINHRLLLVTEQTKYVVFCTFTCVSNYSSNSVHFRFYSKTQEFGLDRLSFEIHLQHKNYLRVKEAFCMILK